MTARTHSRTFKYTADEIGHVRVLKDFLPPPNVLVDTYAEKQAGK